MKRISLHILTMLRQRDNVALPGIGAFRLVYSPAKYDFETKLFLPSSFSVSFRFNPSASGSCLVDSYADREGLTMEEAHSEFDADLTALQSELRASRRVALDGIGTLYLTASGVVKLVSDCNLFNALPIFALAPAEEEIIPVEATVTAVTAEEKNPDYYYIPIPKKLTKIAACFLLAATVCLVALLPVNSWQKGVSTAAIAPITVEKTETIVNTDIPSAKPSAVATDNNEAATINESATSAQLRDEVEQPNPISAPAEAAEESVVNNDEKYFVIVAAFKSQNEVDKFKAEHSKDTNRIQVIKNGTFNLIAVSSASQRADLDSQLPLIRSFYPEAWVYTKK